MRQAHQRAVHVDVFDARKFWVKACAQLEQSRHAPIHFQGALAVWQGAAQHLQQGRFASAIAPHQAHHLAVANLQVHILQRPKLAAVVFKAAPQQLL